MGGTFHWECSQCQEVRGNLETFGIQKKHFGSTPFWFQIPKVALMEAENCLFGILNSSKLIFQA